MFDRERQQEVIGESDMWKVIEFLGRNLGNSTINMERMRL